MRKGEKLKNKRRARLRASNPTTQKHAFSIDTFDLSTISRFEVFGRAIRCPLFMIHKLFTNLMFKLYDEGAAARPGVAPRFCIWRYVSERDFTKNRKNMRFLTFQ